MLELTDLGDDQFDWRPPQPERDQFWIWEFSDDGRKYRNVLLWIGDYRAWQIPGVAGQEGSIYVASMDGARPIREVSTDD